MSAPKSFNVYLNGQRFGGWWEIDGRDVLVSSAYGSKRQAFGRRKPEKVAEEMLLAILAERKP